MPDEIYEIIALAARYWFLLLMVLIAWRSYRWYVRDRKKNKKRMKLLPDAGYIGELVVLRGDDTVKRGNCFLVSREGILGYLRSNDVCVPADGVANRHLWFSFDDSDGLQVEPLRGRMIVADGQELIGRRMRAFLSHGSTLQVGAAKMRLRMFSGFEYAGENKALRRDLDETDQSDLAEELEGRPHADSIRRMHEIAAWQEIQDEEEAVLDAEDAFSQESYPPVEVTDEDDYILPPMDTDEGVSYELQDGTTLFYPPVTDDEDDGFLPPLDDDEDAPRSLYVDEDEAETAKRVLWDKYLKGGKKP